MSSMMINNIYNTASEVNAMRKDADVNARIEFGFTPVSMSSFALTYGIRSI